MFYFCSLLKDLMGNLRGISLLFFNPCHFDSHFLIPATVGLWISWTGLLTDFAC